jgi:hypothetical protein
MYEKNRTAAMKVVQDYRYKVMKIENDILSPLKLSSNALATNTRLAILLSSIGSSLLALVSQHDIRTGTQLPKKKKVADKFNAEGRHIYHSTVSQISIVKLALSMCIVNQ